MEKLGPLSITKGRGKHHGGKTEKGERTLRHKEEGTGLEAQFWTRDTPDPNLNCT